MKLKRKAFVTYDGEPIHNGMIIRYRCGKHTNGEGPDWEEFREGVILSLFERPTPYRNHPSGVNYFYISAHPYDQDFDCNIWDEQHKSFDHEEYITNIPLLSVRFEQL